MERVTPTWAGNYLSIFVCFCVAIVVAHAIGWYFKDHRSRKILAYAAVVLGGISILSISLQSHDEIARIEHRALDWKMKLDSEAIEDSIRSSISILCNLPRVRTVDSPPDFDQIVNSQQIGCKLMHDISAHLKTNWKGAETPYSVPDVGQTSLYSEIVKQEFEELNRVVGVHNQTVEQRRAYVPDPNSAFKALMLLFEPYFAVIALAMGLTLVTFSRSNS